MKRLFSALFLLACLMPLQAQIGYQVSLLNTATGEPQANKTVNVNIAITNAENEVVHTETQTATTNDFGILSLSVGNEDTFKNADWNKLPFYISVSANGTLIGKSQILTVPVAEYAKTAGPVLTKEMLVGTWKWYYSFPLQNPDETTTQYKKSYEYTFNSDKTCTRMVTEGITYTHHCTYEIISNHIYLYENILPPYTSLTHHTLIEILVYIPTEQKIAPIPTSSEPMDLPLLVKQ